MSPLVADPHWPCSRSSCTTIGSRVAPPRRPTKRCSSPRTSGTDVGSCRECSNPRRSCHSGGGKLSFCGVPSPAPSRGGHGVAAVRSPSIPFLENDEGFRSAVTDGSARADPHTSSLPERMPRGFRVGRRPVGSTLLAVRAPKRALPAKGHRPLPTISRRRLQAAD